MRRTYVLKPTPLPTLPAAVRPYPSGRTTVPSACPGITYAAISTALSAARHPDDVAVLDPEPRRPSPG